MVLDQFEITLFRRTEHELFRAGHGHVECSFRYQPPETLPLMRFAVQFIQMVDMNVQNRRFGHRFGIVAAGCLGYETFVGYHHLIFRIEKNILFLRRIVIDIVGPEHAVEDKTQVFANILVFIVKLSFPIGFPLPVRGRQLERAGIDTRELIERVVEDLCFGHELDE